MSIKPIPLARKRILLATVSLLTLLPTTIYLQTRTPHCPPSLILTAPHHGYEWYTLSLATPSLTIYPHATAPPAAAIRRLTRHRNASVVVLPRLDARLPRLLRAAKATRVPVVVLRREIAGAYRALREAGGVMEWGEWESSVEDYFANVAKTVREERVLVDWLWYDNVVWRRFVWLHRNGCHVRNYKLR